MRVLVSFCFLITLTSKAWSLTSVSGHYLNDQFQEGLIQVGLKELCQYFQLPDVYFQCHPSQIETKGSYFKLTGVVGDDYQESYQLYKLIAEDKKIEFTERVVESKNANHLRTSLSLMYSGHRWQVSYTPLRINYFLHVKNKTNPRFTVVGSKSSQAQIQMNLKKKGNWNFGLRGRFVQRKFLADKYFLTDFVGNEDDVLNLQSQNSYYIEPGVKYQFENKTWNPKLLGSLSHVGFSNRYSRYFQNLPTLDLGGSVAPEAFGKRVFLALSSRWKKNSAKKYKWTWRAGSLVNYGILTASLRLGKEDFAAGFYSQFWSSQVGLVYEEFVLGDEGEEKTRVQSLLSQISFVF